MADNLDWTASLKPGDRVMELGPIIEPIPKTSELYRITLATVLRGQPWLDLPLHVLLQVKAVLDTAKGSE